MTHSPGARSAAYPEEDGYHSFLADHGGFANAYTADDRTNFFFEIEPEHLDDTLDRFSGFFISPLLRQSSTSKEVNQVSSEHDKNIESDAWRSKELRHMTSGPPQSLFGRFTTGNHETLDRDGNREALLAFWTEHYKADRMTLSIIGTQSIEELEGWAATIFADIPSSMPVIGGNFNDPLPLSVPSGEPPFEPGYIGTATFTVPVGEVEVITLQFPVPEQNSNYRQNPGGYITYILSSKGEGSLLSFLKANGWATAVVAGFFESNVLFALFGVQISATPLGMQNRVAVIKAVFDAFQLISQPGGVSEVRWNELHLAQQQSFRFREKPGASDLTSDVSVRMSTVAPVDVLGSPQTSFFDANAIIEVLDLLTPERLVLELQSKEFEAEATAEAAELANRHGSSALHWAEEASLELLVGDLTSHHDHWYNFSYGFGPLPPSVVAHWAAPVDMRLVDMQLSRPNIYMMSDFELIEIEPADPSLRCAASLPHAGSCAGESSSCCQKGDGGAPTLFALPAREGAYAARVWFKRDADFGEPRAYTRCLLWSPDIAASARSWGAATLFTRLQTSKMQEDSFEAGIAGMSIATQASPLGFLIASGGYNSAGGKQLELVRAAVALLADLSWVTRGEGAVNEFELAKGKLMRDLQNVQLSGGYQAAMSLGAYVRDGNPLTTDYAGMMEAVADLTPDSLVQTVEVSLSKFALECGSDGNIDAETAKAIARSIEGLLDGVPGGPTGLVLNAPTEAEVSPGGAYSREAILESTCTRLALEPGQALIVQVGSSRIGALSRCSICSTAWSSSHQIHERIRSLVS